MGLQVLKSGKAKTVQTVRKKSHKDLQKEIATVISHNRQLGNFSGEAIKAMRKVHFYAAGMHDGNVFVRWFKAKQVFRIICEALGPYLIEVQQKVDDGVSKIDKGGEDAKSDSSEGRGPVQDSEPSGGSGDTQHDG